MLKNFKPEDAPVLQQIRTNNLASIALHTSLGFKTDGVTYLNAKGNEVCTYKMYLD